MTREFDVAMKIAEPPTKGADWFVVRRDISRVSPFLRHGRGSVQAYWGDDHGCFLYDCVASPVALFLVAL